ncbi:MAG: hypothetical protein BIFFINMI_03618 [Phycisphaerae bacterium]|nr:hypothetical protein [Phycisphaerae bacterium]
MRLLFDLGHPAHFHLFRHTMAAMRDSGDEVVVIAREKECLADLLAADGWSFHRVPRHGRRLAGLGVQSLRTLRLALSLSQPRPFDLMLGTSIVVGAASRLTGATSLAFSEDDAGVIPLQALLSYGPAHYIVTPHCLAGEFRGRRHLTYPGYHELAYLHPARRAARADVHAELGLSPGERFFVVRLVAMRAHHDIGQRGLGPEQVRTIIGRLAAHGRVFVTAEAGLAPDLAPLALPTRPERIFDVLESADLLFGDSATMTAEAAVLGTPAIRCHSFAGRLSYMQELDRRHGLLREFQPEQFHQAVAQAEQWLAQPDLRAGWLARRDAMLAACVDVSGWIIDLLDRLREARSRRVR